MVGSAEHVCVGDERLKMSCGVLVHLEFEGYSEECERRGLPAPSEFSESPCLRRLPALAPRCFVYLSVMMGGFALHIHGSSLGE